MLLYWPVQTQNISVTTGETRTFYRTVFRPLSCSLITTLPPTAVCVSWSVVSDSLRPQDCSSTGSSVHGVLQARILEWVAIPFSRGSSWPRDWTWVSYIARRFFTVWATKHLGELCSVPPWNPEKKWGYRNVTPGYAKPPTPCCFKGIL